MKTDKATSPARLSVRVNEQNENHHLWNNRGVWWCHMTLHRPDSTSQRMRFSLKTKDLQKARERRDRIFQKIAQMDNAAA